MEAIRKKWFTGSDPKFKYDNSKMYQVFENNQHRVWDAVRSLTRLVFHVGYSAQLRSLDQKEVERVADAICELVYSLGKEKLPIEQRGKVAREWIKRKETSQQL